MSIPSAGLRIQGYTLMALCVSLSLGWTLMVVALHAYQCLAQEAKRAHQKMQDGFVFRELWQFLHNDLRFAPYLGPRTQDPRFVIYNQVSLAAKPWFKSDRLLWGCYPAHADCARVLAPLEARLKTRADVLLIYHVPKWCSRLSQGMRSPEDALQLQNTDSVLPGSLVLIADAWQADLVMASSVHATRIMHAQTPYSNRSAALSKNYELGTELCVLETVAYYVGRPKRARTDSDLFSVYRANLFQKSEEIIEGVVTFEIEYQFLDANFNAQFKKAWMIRDREWPQVRGFRLSVVLQSGAKWHYAFQMPQGLNRAIP